jgi:transcriptional repressor NrdR
VQCPYCAGDSSVTETRVTADGMRRRRVCTACKRRFTTYEKLGPPLLKVGKRDGTLEPFDNDKLLTALRRVAAHRSVGDDDLKRVARDIEATLVDSGRKSVLWSDIVTIVLDRLRNIDMTAAHRFAANYTDETGVIRFDATAPTIDPRQLGLPLTDDE